MLLLSCSSKLKMVEATLQRLLPEALQVHGAVRTINRGNPAGYEVLVDTWPDFKAVLTRPCRKEEIDDANFYRNTCAVYYRDNKAYRDLLGGAITWNRAFTIHGFLDGAMDESMEIAQAQGVKIETFSYFIYMHPDPSTLPEIQLDPDMRLSSLNVSHTDLVNDKWDLGGNKYSRRVVEFLIRHFPSFCILDSSDNPVSWVLSNPFGAMACSFTLPQYRRRGYSGIMNILIAKQLHTLGYFPYGYVSIKNYPMQMLQERQGFQRQPSLYLYLIHNTGLDKIPSY